MTTPSIITESMQQDFVEVILPAVDYAARRAFWADDDLRAEARALAWLAYLNRLRRGETEPSPTMIAHYACRDVRHGRRLGHAPRFAKCLKNARPQQKYLQDRPGMEYNPPSREPSPFEWAVIDIDVPAWITTLSAKLTTTLTALLLAPAGSTGRAVAAGLGIDERVLSQRRRRLVETWHCFTT